MKPCDLVKLLFAAVLPFAAACHPPPPAGPATAAEPPAPAAPTRVVMGARHTCALDDGRLWCWGDNTHGQLGDGTRAPRHRPAQVLAGQGPITSVSAGDAHTCAVVGGAVYCWGSNRHGQLGDGTFVDRAVPAPVVGLERSVSDVFTAGSSSCALRDGRPWCWGPASLTPTAIEGVEATGALALDERMGCALTAAEARCWHHGASASAPLTGLPTGARALYLLPPLGALGAWAKLCAIADGGALWCGPLAGQVDGDGRVTGFTVAPARRLDDGVSAMAYESDDHICYIRHGALHCEGNAHHRPWAERLRPAQLASLAAASHASKCVAGEGGVTCWGPNHYGETGAVPRDGTHPHSPPGLERGVTALSTDGSDGLCAARGGEVLCLDRETHALRAIPGISGAVQALSGGLDGGCAISDGALLCWGRDDAGQLGDGQPDETPRARAEPVPGLDRGVTAVAHTGAAVCALQGGAVKCWGANHRKQALPGCADDPCVAPTVISGLEGGVSQLAGAHTHACAIQGEHFERRLVCWGVPGDRGAMGDGAKPGVLNVLYDRFHPRMGASLAVGASRTCALHGGELRCWGEGNARAPRALKMLVGGPSESDRVTLGAAGGCVQTRGQARCWADPDGLSELPERSSLRGLDGAELIVADRFVCGRVAGRVRCIGRGVLPDADYVQRNTVTLPR